MRRNSPISVLLALSLAACTADTAVKVNLELPGEPALDWKAVRAVVLTGFFQEKEMPGLDLSRVLVEYFNDALPARTKAALSEKPVAWPSAEALGVRELWKGAVDGPARTLILTGKASLTQETRKALLDGDRRDIDEGPFKPVSPWSERKAFSLKLDLAIIDPATGEVLFRKDYQETAATDNTRQTAEFALYDLMGRIKPRLFRALFGAERPQDRYLLTR